MTTRIIQTGDSQIRNNLIARALTRIRILDSIMSKIRDENAFLVKTSGNFENNAREPKMFIGIREKCRMFTNQIERKLLLVGEQFR